MLVATSWLLILYRSVPVAPKQKLLAQIGEIAGKWYALPRGGHRFDPGQTLLTKSLRVGWIWPGWKVLFSLVYSKKHVGLRMMRRTLFSRRWASWSSNIYFSAFYWASEKNSVWQSSRSLTITLKSWGWLILNFFLFIHVDSFHSIDMYPIILHLSVADIEISIRK